MILPIQANVLTALLTWLTWLIYKWHCWYLWWIVLRMEGVGRWSAHDTDIVIILLHTLSSLYRNMIIMHTPWDILSLCDKECQQHNMKILVSGKRNSTPLPFLPLCTMTPPLHLKGGCHGNSIPPPYGPLPIRKKSICKSIWNVTVWILLCFTQDVLPLISYVSP